MAQREVTQGDVSWNGPEDSEIPLRYLSIGLWHKRLGKHAHLTALILHSRRSFVFLLDRTTQPTVVKKGLKRVLRHLTAHSPFQSNRPEQGNVLAFEVEWKSIVGMDYSNPLCLSGRMVLESKCITKREFTSMGAVKEYYASKPCDTWDVHQPKAASFAASRRIGQSCTAKLGMQDANFADTSDMPMTPTPLHPSAIGLESHRFSWEKTLSKKRKASEELSPWTRSVEEADNAREAGLLPAEIGPLLPADSTPMNWTGFDESSVDACTIFEFRSITFNFDSPSVPGALRPVIQGDERLLKLYESGLPTWAIYAPQYGMWYRPWMRGLTYMLFIIVSSFSLVVGFYDLYKNVPYLDKVLRQFGATYFPSLNVLKWLDEHVSFRLSILFAYLFGKSELAVQLLRLLATTGNFCKTALQPIGVFVGPPMAIFGAFLQQSWSEVSCAVLFAWDAIEATGRAVFGPPLTALLQALLLLFECCLPILKIVGSAGMTIIATPWLALKLLGSFLGVGGTALVQLARVAAGAAASWWAVVKAGAEVAPTVAGSAKEVGSQVSGLYILVRLEALEVVKNSTVKVVRALQTLARLCSQLAGVIARHRLTLQLRLRRKWKRAKLSMQSATPLVFWQSWNWGKHIFSRDAGICQKCLWGHPAVSSLESFDIGKSLLIGKKVCLAKRAPPESSSPPRHRILSETNRQSAEGANRAYSEVSQDFSELCKRGFQADQPGSNADVS